MKASDLYPSKWFKAADLDGGVVKARIRDVTIETVGMDRADKAVLHFETPGMRPLILNKQNTQALADALGDEMEDWCGHAIELYPAMTEYNGKAVETVRVRLAKKPKPTAAKPAVDPELDDDIAF